MNRKLRYGLSIAWIALIGGMFNCGRSPKANARLGTYSGDSIAVTIKGLKLQAQTVPYGANVKGVLFDGYPQIVKQEGSKPIFKVKKEKDVMVSMRDGVRIAVDIYRPDVAGEKFPAIVAWGTWGKDNEEAVAWNADKPQPYYYSPFWDGTMEAGNYMYTVPRGYVHVIPEPRGIGKSEGYGKPGPLGVPGDEYDTIEWVAAQPWCTGKVGMMGPSAYSRSQIAVAPLKPPHLTAIHMDEGVSGYGDHFDGIFDTLGYHIGAGRHGNDSPTPVPDYEYTPTAPASFSLPKEELERRVAEALEDPDFKYNTKFHSFVVYPRKAPGTFDQILNYFHPRPGPPAECDKISIPTNVGVPYLTHYVWGCAYIWEHLTMPEQNRRLMLYPPGYAPRPYADYHDEVVRWYDYWLKGIDNGLMDEPRIKIFVMGVNKWKFENEWPVARTKWTNYYLHPGGGLSPETVAAASDPESFTQPAPYQDPTVYCIRYSTGSLKQDLEITGPLALYLEASINIDDTNWLVDLVDVDPQGNRLWLSTGGLKAKFRAIDESKSKPYRPVHPQQDAVPVPPNKVLEYAIEMMPMSCIFQKGHSMELIIRNQDDVLSRLGTWGRYKLPFMRTVTHKIYFGKSHLLLPVISGDGTLVAQR